MAPADRTPPPKRHWIAFVAVACFAVAVVALWAWLRPAPRGAVIVISIDTLRADHLPLYGYTKGRTPAIDALAKDAITFERAYAHTPQTLPSHASILTGLLPFEHGVRDNLGFSLKVPTLTLASMLKAGGYRTGAFVSAYVLRPETGLNQGFDVYNAEFPAGPQERSVTQVQRAGADTLAAAQAWLATLINDKFFLFFHIYEPHRPYTPPATYADLTPYDGEVAYADEIVGQLLTTLRERGWFENATIVLTSDHGEGLGDHGEDEHGLFVYDSTIHVPLIIKMTADHDGGNRVADPVQHIDLVPTIATLNSVKYPKGLRGRNLVPLLVNTGKVARQGLYAEAMYARYHLGWSELFSMIDEHYQFIEAPRAELYDLEQDPPQLANVVGVHPQVATAMRSALDSLIANRRLDAPAAATTQDRERLLALGYVGVSSPLPPVKPGATLPDPKDTVAIFAAFRKAIDETRLGQFTQGAEGFRAILAKEPAMTDVWSRYGAVLLDLGRPEEALKAFQAVIRLQPGETVALIDAATALMQMGRLKDARAQAELAVGGMPAAAHELLARIALDLKEPEVAMGEAALAARADPTLAMPDYVHGVIAYRNAENAPKAEQLNRYEDALADFMRSHDRHASRAMAIAELHYYIADCLTHLGRADEAEKFYKDELSLYPKNVRARAGLAMLYQSANRSADAADVIAAMMTAVPTPASYEQAATLFTQFGHPDRAAAIRVESRSRFGR